MAGFPIRYVAREIRNNGEVVAYFVSKAHLFQEIKEYHSNGTYTQKYEIDFVSHIYNEQFEVENSPAMKKYYKDKVFENADDCARFVNFQNYLLWQNLTNGLSFTEIKKKQRKLQQPFKFAIDMQDKYESQEAESSNN